MSSRSNLLSKLSAMGYTSHKASQKLWNCWKVKSSVIPDLVSARVRLQLLGDPEQRFAVSRPPSMPGRRCRRAGTAGGGGSCQRETGGRSGRDRTSTLRERMPRVLANSCNSTWLISKCSSSRSYRLILFGKLRRHLPSTWLYEEQFKKLLLWDT